MTPLPEFRFSSKCVPVRAWPWPRRKASYAASSPSAKQHGELVRMYGAGEYTIVDLAEVFAVSRATVDRALQRESQSGDTR